MAYFRTEKSTKILKKLLWTNPSPLSAFAAQTLSLDLSKYDGVLIESSLSTASTLDGFRMPVFVPKDGNEYYVEAGQSKVVPPASNIGATIYLRLVTVTDFGVTFSTGYAGPSSTNTSVCIPYRIYGYVYEPDVITRTEKKLLWNNPSPTTQFAAQTLSLDLSKYEAVIIKCSWQTNYNTDTQKVYQIFNYVPKDGATHYISSLLGTGNTVYANRRQVTVTDSGITFTDGWSNGTNNVAIIPIEIYGYVCKEQMDEPDSRKFILKDGILQGTQGTDYGVLGTLTQNTGFVSVSGTGYASGLAIFISASDKTKYKRVVFDSYVANATTVRLYYSTTETGSRTAVSTGQWAVNLNTLSDDIFLYLMANDGAMSYYNIYLE